MDQIIVTNVRKIKPEGYTTVYIGRPSPLGNPYHMKCEADRAHVCEMFARHLYDMRNNSASSLWVAFIDLYFRAAKGEKLALQCFCAPKQCHGDAIKIMLDAMLHML